MKQLKEKEYEEFQKYQYNKIHGYIWTPDTIEMICAGNEYDPERIGKQLGYHVAGPVTDLVPTPVLCRKNVQAP